MSPLLCGSGAREAAGCTRKISERKRHGQVGPSHSNHVQSVFAEFSEILAVTEQLYEEILSLPLYYDRSNADVEEVIAPVCAYLRQGG